MPRGWLTITVHKQYVACSTSFIRPTVVTQFFLQQRNESWLSPHSNPCILYSNSTVLKYVCISKETCQLSIKGDGFIAILSEAGGLCFFGAHKLKSAFLDGKIAYFYITYRLKYKLVQHHHQYCHFHVLYYCHGAGSLKQPQPVVQCTISSIPPKTWLQIFEWLLKTKKITSQKRFLQLWCNQSQCISV